MRVQYLHVPLLHAGTAIRYANSMCSCVMSSGLTVSTHRQAAFSSCRRGAILQNKPNTAKENQMWLRKEKLQTGDLPKTKSESSDALAGVLVCMLYINCISLASQGNVAALSVCFYVEVYI